MSGFRQIAFLLIPPPKIFSVVPAYHISSPTTRYLAKILAWVRSPCNNLDEGPKRADSAIYVSAPPRRIYQARAWWSIEAVAAE
jgi:hypothetical protein